MTGVRHLSLDGDRGHARCEHDDGWLQAELQLPAVLSCAERLCEPAKVDPTGAPRCPRDRIRRRRRRRPRRGPVGAGREPDAGRRGEGAWPSNATARRWPDAPVAEQVRRAGAAARDRGALDSDPRSTTVHAPVPTSRDATDRCRWSWSSPTARTSPRAARRGRAAARPATCSRSRVEPTTTPSGSSRGAPTRSSICAARTSKKTSPRRSHDLGAANRRGRSSSGAPRGARGRVARRGPPRRRPHRRRGRARSRRRPAGRVEARVRRSARRRDHRDVSRCRWRRSAPACSRTRAARPRRAIGHEPIASTRAAASACSPRTRDDDLDVLAEANAVVGVGVGVDPADYPMLDPLLAAARRRARRDPQGHRQGLAAPRPPDRHHRPQRSRRACS